MIMFQVRPRWLILRYKGQDSFVFCLQISLQKVFSVSNFLGNLSEGGVG